MPGASYNTGLEDLWILPLGEHHAMTSFATAFLAEPFRARDLRLVTCRLPLTAAMVTNLKKKKKQSNFENQSGK